MMNIKHRQAGLQSAKTKGARELRRAGLMSQWTKKHGKNDWKNPFSKQNYYLHDLADLDEVDSVGSVEGRTYFVQHVMRERSQTISRQKENAVLASTGALECEACQFDFAKKYGKRGIGFCEVHHIRPLSSLTGKTKTRLDDLIVLCSNCHRMIHRKEPFLTLDELRAIIRKNN